MSAPAQGLEALRRRIDAIDDRIHDLLIERSGVVADIALIKRQGDSGWYRPGREAQMLRRLVARHHGPLPKPSLVRLWREILGAATRQQTDFRAAAVRDADGGGSWELAHDHFGGGVPLQVFSSPGQVLSCVAEGKATVGVLPLPAAEEPQPWWPQLLRLAEVGVRVVARLPFAADASGKEGLAVARTGSEPTGRDRALLAIETPEPLSRAGLHAAMAATGLSPALLAGDPAAARAGRSLHLADVAGDSGEDQIARLLARLAPQAARVLRLGGYAEPLGRNELAP